MYKIGVIGDRGAVAGFIALGYSIFEADDADMAGDILKRLVSETSEEEENGYAIVFITQKYAEALDPEIRRYEKLKLPAITVLPEKSEDGSLSYGMRKIKDHVEKAVGADILFREQK